MIIIKIKKEKMTTFKCWNYSEDIDVKLKEDHLLCHEIKIEKKKF